MDVDSLIHLTPVYHCLHFILIYFYCFFYFLFHFLLLLLLLPFSLFLIFLFSSQRWTSTSSLNSSYPSPIPSKGHTKTLIYSFNIFKNVCVFVIEENTIFSIDL